MHNEIDFIEEHIKKTSVDPYRGLSVIEWDSTIKEIHDLVDKCQSKREYLLCLRRFGAIINDGHEVFPEEGIYNRMGLFKGTDSLFPIWVKVWEDGRVFVRKDYSHTVPDCAELIKINGVPAKDLALDMRSINLSELGFAAQRGESVEMIDPYIWNSFINYLFCEGFLSPFEIQYKTGDTVKTAIIQGIERKALQNWYDKDVGKEIMEKDSPWYYLTKMGKNTISFHVEQDSIAVLKISSWIGSNALKMMITRRDRGFTRRIKRIMDEVIEKTYPHLVIDLRGNDGGYGENAIDLLHYFTDIPFPYADVYRVNSKNRKAIKKILKNTYSQPGSKLAKDSYKILAGTIEGEVFRSDTLIKNNYNPPKGRKRYSGNVYVLTDRGSYSASIVFCNLIRQLELGVIAGTSPGGYSVVTDGNALSQSLPYSKDFILAIPFCLSASEKREYEYLHPDIPLYPELNEWLYGNYDSLESLLQIISKGG